MHRTPLRRALPAAALSLALLVAASGCGDDNGADGRPGDPTGGATTSATPEGAAPLSIEQAEAVALTPADLGAGWAEDLQAVEEDDEPIVGCIGEIDNLSEMGERPVEVRKAHRFEDGLPQVTSRVTVFASEEELVEVFDRIETAIEECEAVDYTEDGATFRITLEPETDLPVDGVDDQNGFTASGTITEADGQSYPVHLHMARFRVGPNVTSVSIISTKDEAAIHGQYARIAAERLVTTAS